MSNFSFLSFPYFHFLEGNILKKGGESFVHMALINIFLSSSVYVNWKKKPLNFLINFLLVVFNVLGSHESCRNYREYLKHIKIGISNQLTPPAAWINHTRLCFYITAEIDTCQTSNIFSSFSYPARELNIFIVDLSL